MLRNFYPQKARRFLDVLNGSEKPFMDKRLRHPSILPLMRQALR